ncbi:MAG: hypothetical protein F6K17_06370 [Okeania sp. SIO3C4]|nr:hypothetical protein [Okeania sp. SIO3C4]
MSKTKNYWQIYASDNPPNSFVEIVIPFLCNNALNNSYPNLNFTNSCCLLLSATSWRNGIKNYAPKLSVKYLPQL